jgi:hypothetical protein
LPLILRHIIAFPGLATSSPLWWQASAPTAAAAVTAGATGPNSNRAAARRTLTQCDRLSLPVCADRACSADELDRRKWLSEVGDESAPDTGLQPGARSACAASGKQPRSANRARGGGSRPTLPAAVDRRGKRGLLHSEGSRRPVAGLCCTLKMSRAGERRQSCSLVTTAADRREHRHTASASDQESK